MYIATGGMIRHIGPTAWVIGHEHIPWTSFNLRQLSLSQALGIFVRPTEINIIGSPYVGPLGLIGTLLAGIYFSRLDSFQRMLAVAFGVICLYGLLSSFGTNLGFAYLNFYVPLINRIREAGRHLVLFIVGAAFLSGLGYDLLARSVERFRQSHQIRLLILPTIVLSIFAAVILWQLCQYGYSWLPARFWILCLAPSLFLLSRVCRLKDYSNVVLATLFVSTAAMVVPILGVPVSHSEFTKPINLLSHRIIRELAPKIDAKGYRMDFRDSSFPSSFWAMNASYYGIKSFYNQLTPQPLDQFNFIALRDTPHLREMMGTRYVLCGPADSLIDTGGKQILETEGYRLYENADQMGRLRLVHRIAGHIDSEADFIGIIGKGFNYFSDAYVTSRDIKRVQAFLGNGQPSSAQERIFKIIDEPNRSYSTVVSASPSVLILNEWFTPAWKVRVNDKAQPVLRVNQWQTGVLLPAGRNRVEFKYDPALFRTLMVLNRITILLLLLFVVLERLRRRRLDIVRPQPG
jgi:hypothetical protein